MSNWARKVTKIILAAYIVYLRNKTYFHIVAGPYLWFGGPGDHCVGPLDPEPSKSKFLQEIFVERRGGGSVNYKTWNCKFSLQGPVHDKLKLQENKKKIYIFLTGFLWWGIGGLVPGSNELHNSKYGPVLYCIN